MNYSTAIFLIDDRVRAILCQYEPEEFSKTGVKQYVFKTLDATIKVDDLVVVPTSTRYGMTVVKVIGVNTDFDFDGEIQLKWVVGKVDKPAYESILAQEEQALTIIRSAEKTKKRNELRDALLKDNAELKTFSITTDVPVLPAE